MHAHRESYYYCHLHMDMEPILRMGQACSGQHSTDAEMFINLKIFAILSIIIHQWNRKDQKHKSVL